MCAVIVLVAGTLAGCGNAPSGVEGEPEKLFCEVEGEQADAADHAPDYFPFDSLPRSALTASPRKVFAHYFPPYPLNFNNDTPEADYYERHYLRPEGEKGRFYSKGGLLRQKPMTRPAIPEFEPFRMTDIRHEINLAAMIGLDGFAADILNLSGNNWNQVVMLLDAAAEQYADFRILLMPDMNAELKRKPEAFVPLIQTLAAKPAAFRLPDGRLVVAPYMAQNQSPTWWAERKTELSRLGVEIALVPVFHNWRKELKRFQEELPDTYREVLYGVSDWGVRSMKGVRSVSTAADELRRHDLLWMAPVAPQDMRPKSSIFTESSNSGAYRAQWESAIAQQADWVHVISWNDYSETTEIAPSTRTGYAFYDLTAYYVEWFKVAQPAITRDVLYGFYRTQSYDEAELSRRTPSRFELMKPVGGMPPENKVELLSFLQAQGVVTIEQDEVAFRQQAIAGLSSHRTALENGVPVFELSRQNSAVLRISGREAIQKTDGNAAPDFMYQGVSSARDEFELRDSLVSWPWRYERYDSQITLNASGKASPSPRRWNQWPVVHTDNSDSASAGFGFSVAASVSNTTYRILADFKLQSTSDGPVKLYLSLLDKEKKISPLQTLHNDAAHCRTSELPTDKNGVYVRDGTWYQIELIVEKASSDVAHGRLRIADIQREHQVYEKYISVQGVPVPNGLVFKVGSAPAEKGAVHVDNVFAELLE